MKKRKDVVIYIGIIILFFVLYRFSPITRIFAYVILAGGLIGAFIAFIGYLIARVASRKN